MVDAMKFSYEGKRVLVTGGGSGMGEAAARILGELGAEVHILDVRKPTVPNAAFYETDLADRTAIDKTVAAVTAGGRIDRLFSCAGLAPGHPPQKVMLVNFVGHRHLAESLLDHIPEGGAMVSISSGAGVGWQANIPTCMELIAQPTFEEAQAWCEAHPVEVREGYTLSKEALVVWALSNAVKFGTDRKIRINVIAPGPTATNMMPEIVSVRRRPGLHGLVPEAARPQLHRRGAGVAARVPQQRRRQRGQRQRDLQRPGLRRRPVHRPDRHHRDDGERHERKGCIGGS
jgi:NAD(P)-dependent dehydrogenase (short-subunit alcohol dehydrogenase family)